jgi:hypothetical protein
MLSLDTYQLHFFYCCWDWCVEDDSTGSKSLLSITAMAKLRIPRNLSRRIASDSGEEVLLVLVLVFTTTLLLDSAAIRMLLLKVVLGLVRLLSEVFCALEDGDFIVI